MFVYTECFATDNLIPFVYYQAIAFDCCNKAIYFQFEQSRYNIVCVSICTMDMYNITHSSVCVYMYYV